MQFGGVERTGGAVEGDICNTILGPDENTDLDLYGGLLKSWSHDGLNTGA
jgi:hypothetical protein